EDSRARARPALRSDGRPRGEGGGGRARKEGGTRLLRVGRRGCEERLEGVKIIWKGPRRGCHGADARRSDEVDASASSRSDNAADAPCRPRPGGRLGVGGRIRRCWSRATPRVSAAPRALSSPPLSPPKNRS